MVITWQRSKGVDIGVGSAPFARGEALHCDKTSKVPLYLSTFTMEKHHTAVMQV